MKKSDKWWYRLFLLLDAPLLGIFIGLVATIAINLFTNPAFNVLLCYYDLAILNSIIAIILLIRMTRIRTTFDIEFTLAKRDNDKSSAENYISPNKVSVDTYYELISNTLNKIYLAKALPISKYWFSCLFLPFIILFTVSLILIYNGHKKLEVQSTVPSQNEKVNSLTNSITPPLTWICLEKQYVNEAFQTNWNTLGPN